MIFNVAMQGTYLDTILPRADLAENQAAMPEIGERDNMITRLYSYCTEATSELSHPPNPSGMTHKWVI